MKNKDSKYLTYLLRHKPEKEKLSMDKNGWVSVQELLTKLDISKEDLNLIVLEDDKKRFEYNVDESKIRACQGHSVKVDLGFKKTIPPVILYHGSSNKFLTNVLKKGLLKMNRLHVHLSKDLDTAQIVGKRKGKDIIIYEVDTKSMHKDGFIFFLSSNGVWLTDNVPPRYINKK